jgi:hypothetical protein
MAKPIKRWTPLKPQWFSTHTSLSENVEHRLKRFGTNAAMKHVNRGHISTQNVLLLLVIFFVCLGTLASDDRTARPSETEQWSGERAKFMLEIAGAADHVDGFEPSRRHDLYVELFDIAESAAAGARWHLTIEGQNDYELKGGFEFQEENSFHEDSTKLGYVTATLGEFCKGEESTDAMACIPCSLTEGCRLSISIDLCQPMFLNEAYFSVSVQPEGTDYEAYCSKDDDPAPCDRLSGWLSLTADEQATTLCEQ